MVRRRLAAFEDWVPLFNAVQKVAWHAGSSKPKAVDVALAENIDNVIETGWSTMAGDNTVAHMQCRLYFTDDGVPFYLPYPTMHLRAVKAESEPDVRYHARVVALAEQAAWAEMMKIDRDACDRVKSMVPVRYRCVGMPST